MRIQLGCAALLLAISGVHAAEPAYPAKPVRIIVGFAPAGAADITARVLGQRLAALWGQPVVTDNRPGAGSTIGSEIAAGTTPDGHTLMVVSASYATSAGLYKKLAFDPVKSFIPITTLTPRVAALRSEQEIERIAAQVRLKRLAVPEDHAQAMLFLASDAAAYINGIALDVNGGRVMM